MAVNEPSRPTLGIQKTDFMQNSSFNFLENERTWNIMQRGGVHNQTDECDSTIRDGKHTSVTRIVTQNDDTTGKSTKTTSALSRTDAMPEQTILTTDTRQETGRFAPKRYVTKCFFQPKQNPVSYSETVILTLGSSKKHYFETVLYQTQLVPFRWTESMTTLTPASGDAFEARHEAFMEEPKYHYMSLEPQQASAVEKIRASEEICV